MIGAHSFSMLQDKIASGWIAWEDEVTFSLAPDSSYIGKWEAASQPAVEAIRSQATTTSFWEALKVHYSEENQSGSVNWDNVSFVKSICETVA